MSNGAATRIRIWNEGVEIPYDIRFTIAAMLVIVQELQNVRNAYQMSELDVRNHQRSSRN